MGPSVSLVQMKRIRFAHRMTAHWQDIWACKYHKLWEKLEKNTRDPFCTALWKWLVRTFATAALGSMQELLQTLQLQLLYQYRITPHTNSITTADLV